MAWLFLLLILLLLQTANHHFFEQDLSSMQECVSATFILCPACSVNNFSNKSVVQLRGDGGVDVSERSFYLSGGNKNIPKSQRFHFLCYFPPELIFPNSKGNFLSLYDSSYFPGQKKEKTFTKRNSPKPFHEFNCVMYAYIYKIYIIFYT